PRILFPGPTATPPQSRRSACGRDGRSGASALRQSNPGHGTRADHATPPSDHLKGSFSAISCSIDSRWRLRTPSPQAPRPLGRTPRQARRLPFIVRHRNARTDSTLFPATTGFLKRSTTHSANTCFEGDRVLDTLRAGGAGLRPREAVGRASLVHQPPW